MGKKLKNYNLQIVSILLLNIGLVFLEKIIIIENHIVELKIELITNQFLYVTIMPIIVFILLGLIPAEIKATFVFFRIKYPLPGCRVFSKLMSKDKRISKDDFNSKYGDIPNNPQEENNLWYKIYSKYKTDEMIVESHRDFLKSRDITTVIFLFIIGYIIASLILKEFSLKILLFIIIEYVFVAISAQNYGKRFALNVLALDLNQ